MLSQETFGRDYRRLRSVRFVFGADINLHVGYFSEPRFVRDRKRSDSSAAHQVTTRRTACPLRRAFLLQLLATWLVDSILHFTMQQMSLFLLTLASF